MKKNIYIPLEGAVKLWRGKFRWFEACAFRDCVSGKRVERERGSTATPEKRLKNSV